MNINKPTNGVGGSGAAPDAPKPIDTAKVSNRSADSPPQSGSDVKLSQETKSIKQIEAEVSKLPDIDDAAVERIKGALANNEYKIDYERIAGKMIKFDSLLK